MKKPTFFSICLMLFAVFAYFSGSATGNVESDFSKKAKAEFSKSIEASVSNDTPLMLKYILGSSLDITFSPLATFTKGNEHLALSKLKTSIVRGRLYAPN